MFFRDLTNLKNLDQHSSFVLITKLVCIIVVVLISITLLVMTFYHNSANKVALQINQNNENNQKNILLNVINPKIDGFTNKTNSYIISSTKVSQINDHQFEITDPVFQTKIDKFLLSVTSKNALYYIDKKIALFNDNVIAKLDEQYKLLTSKIWIYLQEGKLSTLEKTYINKDKSFLTSDSGFKYQTKNKQVTFSGPITGKYFYSNNDIDFLDISSNEMIIDLQTKKAILEKQVNILQKESSMQAEKIAIDLHQKNSTHRKIYIYNNIILKTKDHGEITANYGEYDINKNILYLSQNLKVKKGNSILLGEYFEYSVKTQQGKILKSGNKKKPVQARIIFNNEK